jgi:CheY-like chemotaxis protein
MGSKTVLLVEDDLEIRDILQDVLEADGFDVFPASNGKQALDFLNLNQPQKADLVILDLMMPMVSGWQVMEQMHQDPRLQNIPILVLSAVARDKPFAIISPAPTRASDRFTLSHLIASRLVRFTPHDRAGSSQLDERGRARGVHRSPSADVFLTIRCSL